MPKDNRPRWINVHTVPYDYPWPDRSAVTAFKKPGDYFVKAEIADHAVGKKVATEGKSKGSTAKSSKSRRTRAASKSATRPAKARKPVGDGAASLTGQDDRMGRAGVAPADRVDTGGAVGPDASE